MLLQTDSRRKIRFLFIDDDPTFLDEVKSTCNETEDIRLETTTNAKEALKMIENQKYDAIISDYIMPNMNGLELLERTRNLGVTSPFIIVTGKGKEKVAMEALNLGANKYYKKEQFTNRCKELIQEIIKEVEKERESQEHYTQIFEKYPHPILQANLKGKILALNQAMSKNHQTKSKNIVGENLEKLYPKSAQKLLKKAKKAIKENQIKVIPNMDSQNDEEHILLPVNGSEQQIFQIITKPKYSETNKKPEIHNLNEIKNTKTKKETCKIGLQIIANLIGLEIYMMEIVGLEDPCILKKSPISVIVEPEKQEQKNVIKEVNTIKELEIEQENFQEAITLPIGNKGVFQAASTKSNSFNQEDIQIIKKILRQINQTLKTQKQ